MPSERFEMRVPVELLRRVDAVRGHESRASFFKRAAVAMLGARVPPLDSLGPSPSPALMAAAAEASMRQRFVPGEFERAEALGETRGCPDCGGLWQRREGVPGRFCVDCGGMEAR